MEIYYESHGAGEPLVLIPGFAAGAWTWFEQIEDLSKTFQVIAFDPRGVSRSPVNGNSTETVSLQTIAADIAGLLDFLQIEKAHVLGVSFGGFVAQEFALAFPERLKKLILACTSFGGKNHVAPDLEVLAAFVAADDLNKRERVRRFMIPAFTPEFVAARADVIEKVCRLRVENVVPEKVYSQQMTSAVTFDAECRIAQIQAETLVLTGDRDIVVPPPNSENLAKAIPNSTLKIIESGSHMFFIENSKEFNRIITDFLKS
ncbi:MAG TPA: alpha/beta hydrolase [Pyrinomonadaceae bacterium]|jgi:pimeloyl-ACP methyl ester carboxylesterase